jgi:hypothetical protein
VFVGHKIESERCTYNKINYREHAAENAEKYYSLFPQKGHISVRTACPIFSQVYIQNFGEEGVLTCLRFMYRSFSYGHRRHCIA